MSLTSSFRELLLNLSHVMTQPTFQSLLIIVTGWLFARRRTVTGIIQAAGAVGLKHHSAFHRLFAKARWSPDAFGLAVFDLVVRWLPKDRPVLIAVDDTLARKRGLKIFGVGMHHDPILSSRGKAIVNWGHSWVVLGVLIQFPFRRGHWLCLPLLFRLYRSKQTVQSKGGIYRTRPQLAVEMLEILCKAHSTRGFHLVVDSLYSGKSVVGELPENCDLTGRAHMDAGLFDPPPKPRPTTRGRPRTRGRRRLSPRRMLKKGGRTVTLDIYGRRETLRLVECVALWYSVAGKRSLRIVAVEPLSSGRKPQAFYSTCKDATAEEVLRRYARRWSIEVAFHDAKGHLGFEQPQGWSRKAVERTAPMAMLLYSLVVLWYARWGHKRLRLPRRPWYRQKSQVSFADMLTTLRRECLRETFLATPVWDRHSIKIVKSLIDLCSRAA